MSRRTTAKKRQVIPDPIYRSRLVSMMISRLLQDGKKSLAARLFYESLDHISQQMNPSVSNKTQVNKDGSTKASTARLNGTNLSNSGTSAKTERQEKPENISTRSNNGSALGSSADVNRSSPVGQDALKIFQQAVVHVTPVVEVKSRRVGGSNYQVPLEVSSERGTALALRWIVQSARSRPGREMAIKLANEILDASNKTGNAIRKKEETHKNAEANKAFANYRF